MPGTLPRSGAPSRFPVLSISRHDKNGKAIIISDGAVPVHSNPLRPGQLAYEIWKTNAMPIPIGRDEPDPVAAKR